MPKHTKNTVSKIFRSETAKKTVVEIYVHPLQRLLMLSSYKYFSALRSQFNCLVDLTLIKNLRKVLNYY
jgi:hypothetical protein